MISIPACKRGRIALSSPPSSYLHATSEENGFYAHREQVGGEAGRDTRSHPGLHVTPPYTGTLPIETSDASQPHFGISATAVSRTVIFTSWSTSLSMEETSSGSRLLLMEGADMMEGVTVLLAAAVA
jgi:hypothetical protein